MKSSGAMRQALISVVFFLIIGVQAAPAIQAPTGIVSRTGDRSIVLHWDSSSDPSLAGYRVYRSTVSAGGPFTLVTTTPLTSPGYCDLSGSVVNGQTNFYYVTAVSTASQESTPSSVLGATSHLFASDDEFLDYVQETCFDYFWYLANPANGLVPDRSTTTSPCSIAAVGFGLTAIGIAIDHGWISRTQGVARVLTTLNTFLNGPQGSGTSGTIGYKGWFYHFLDMNTALRSGGTELSSIDTALLLGGILYAKQYFDGPSTDEASIRAAADTIFNRVDWTFMSQGSDGVAMQWLPTGGFSGTWVGYNEGMIIYCLGLGTATNPLPASAWNRWTSGYNWINNYGQSYVHLAPMFVYQYSHCWIDFRHIADVYMNSHNCTYFENSRRASLAQVAYAIANPNSEVGYSVNVWGLTASDGPSGYNVHGIPPNGSDDGTIAPTAAGGSMPFTPEYSVPTLRYFYSHYRPFIWTAYSFRDAFNLTAGAWYGTDELGIDQGPIVIMIENYRTQRVWQLFMQNPEVERGLQRAGFVSLPYVGTSIQPVPSQPNFNLSWLASTGRYYQVEYSPQLSTWSFSPGFVFATNNALFNWLDAGPPATVSAPAITPQRFYRVFQIGTP